jgi:H+/gluconate symporter-like permease
MAESGAAASIAEALARRLGAERALWIVVLACALLTYGGVVVFVVLFAVYPLGLKLIEQAGIPKRLLAAAIGLGAGTFTMTALPGTPSIHNVIAAAALGTDLYAGAWLGLAGGALMLALGMAWLERERRRSSVPRNSPQTVATDGEMARTGRWRWCRSSVVLGLILVPRLLALAAAEEGR